MLGTASRNTENIDKMAKDIETSTYNGDEILLKHNWNPIGRKEEADNNTDNSDGCERGEYNVHLGAYSSQESETEDMNSSLELFSTNDSFCSENVVNQSVTQSKYYTNPCGKEMDIVTCIDVKDIDASSPNHKNNSESSKICVSRTNTYISSDIQENNFQGKGKKRRKISDSEFGMDDAGSNSTLQGEVLMIAKNTPETEKMDPHEKSINSQSDVKSDSSSIKKKCRLALSHKNMSPSRSKKPNISTPQSKIRKMCNTSPASIKSIMELSPAHLTKRNQRGEGLLHIAAIKVFLILIHISLF